MENKIETRLKENRVFAPSKEFAAQAHINTKEEYFDLWLEAKQSPDIFFGRYAEKFLNWNKRWKKVLEVNDYKHEWFVGGEINACFNCVDRHAEDTPNKKAIIWEGEYHEKRTLSFFELKDYVCQVAQALEELGAKKGDVVTIYMPVIPETLVVMLACARIGAIHNVVFAGFSAKALAERVRNSQSKIIVTANYGLRRGKELPLKETVDEACKEAPSVQHVLLFPRVPEKKVHLTEKDHLWDDIVLTKEKNHTPAKTLATDPLFVLYTSGSTGLPKGLIHNTGGYLLGTALSAYYIFDLKPDDIFWCTADFGWITGHSYSTYGPLAHGTTIFLYEGSFDTPHWGRAWEIIERYKITKLYTAPTAIRAFMRYGADLPAKYDLSSLKLLGSVGEPISPEVWHWYWQNIGRGNCPIVDTWWQTETGSIMMAPLPGVTQTKPGSCGWPFFGVCPEIHQEGDFSEHETIAKENGGALAISQPWPSMASTIINDHERFKQTYWQSFPGQYFTGDGARKDADGFYWVLGRIDDVINVSGHRLSTMEIESALLKHPRVFEAAAVGIPDELRGEGVCCFVCLKNLSEQEDFTTLRQDIIQLVRSEIGDIAKPAKILVSEGLPKTRSGKIMRRVLKQLACGKTPTGDLTTLEDRLSLERLREI